MTYYSIYDKENGLIVCQGDAKKCADYLNTTVNSFRSSLAKNHKQPDGFIRMKHHLVFKEGNVNDTE